MSASTYRCAYLLGPEKIEMRDVPRSDPGDGELLIAIDAATTCGTDVKVFRRGGHPRMLKPPCPFGHEIAGTIIESGRGVVGWQPGERVVVANSAPCGACAACDAERENLCLDLQYLNGAFAERLIVPARFTSRSLHRLSATVSASVGALAEPLACVVHGLDRMRLATESDVLVIGGGPIGLMFAYLLAAESHRVTLADPHPKRLALARALGAQATHHIVDRKALSAELCDFGDASSGFDATVDATGSTAGWRAAIDAVRPGGVVNLFGGCAPGTEIPLDTQRAHYNELTLLGCYHHRPATFARAMEILSASNHPLARLVSCDRPLQDVEWALRAMIERRAVKVAIRPGSTTTAN